MVKRKRQVNASAVLLVIGLVTLGGCVRREESITIHEDGSVDIVVEASGDRADMEDGLPALARAPGWTFTQHLVTEENGKQKINRKLARTVKPGDGLPDTYPVADDSASPLLVQHPTTLEVEERADGTYFHFRRVYRARPWAFVNYWWSSFYESFAGQKPNEMPDEKKEEFVRGLIDAECHERAEFVKNAAAALDPPLSQDVELSILQAVTDVVRTTDVQGLLEALSQDEDADDGDSGSTLRAIAEGVDNGVADAIEETLRRSGESRRRIADFQEHHDRERRRFAFTKDYEDESWDIQLTMPGRVVGHNGKVTDDGEIQWEFDGKQFFDRDIVLMATSVVTRDDR